MADWNAVHQCLFCPQTFGSAIEKDDHILEHFPHEMCTECDQNLIRIGSFLYTPHNTITCIKSKVKTEKYITVTEYGTESATQTCQNYKDKNNGEDADDDWLATSANQESIFIGEMQIKPEPFEQENMFMEIDSAVSSQETYVNTDTQNEIKSSLDDETEEEIRTVSMDEGSTMKMKDKKTNHKECDICGKLMLSKSLKRHKAVRHGEPGSCDKCAKVFPNEEELVKHKEECSNRRMNLQVECNICGKSYFDKGTLRRHRIAVHTKEGTHFCSTCDEVFGNEAELSAHKVACNPRRKRIEREVLDAPEIDALQLEPPLLHDQSQSNPEENQTEKTETQPENVKIECNFCGESFLDKKVLRRHRIVKHSEPGTHFCRACVRIFPNESDLSEHKTKCRLKQNIRRKRSVECEICNKRIIIASLQRHMRTMHSEPGTYVCKICSKIFNTGEELLQHTEKCKLKKGNRKDRQSGEFVCDICGKVFRFKDNLRMHKRAVHVPPSVKMNKRVMCDTCGNTYYCKRSLEQHKIRMHSEPGTIICNYCVKIFSTTDELAKHRPVCKSIRERWSRAPNRILECYICRKIVKSKKVLTSHMRNMHDASREKAQCHLCGLSFHKESMKKHHEHVHLNIRKFPCTMCDKRLKTNLGLQTHMLIHSDQKFPHCQYDGCGRFFKTLAARDKHMKRHTMQKPLCTIDGCNQQFAYKKYWRKHMFEIHGISIRTGHTIYKHLCTVDGCNQQFTFKKYWRKHMNEVHGISIRNIKKEN